MPTVIYENEHFLIIDKPSGLLTHAVEHSFRPTLADWLVERDSSLSRVGDPARPGIVHRLDRDTSGMMVVAKDQPTYLWLKDAFRNRQVKKSYRLIVQGLIKKSSGIIDFPIGRSRQDPRRRVAAAGAAGPLRQALTTYQVLATFENETYLEAYPQTGRTHQLRVHFKAIQHPLVGDQLYGGNLPESPTINRLALHAYCLELPARAGQNRMFIAPLPLDFFSALVRWRRS
ncbi:MAG: RluA family pseudouridine synthase [Patescibacteria group bacterium]